MLQSIKSVNVEEKQSMTLDGIELTAFLKTLKLRYSLVTAFLWS